AWSRAFYFGSVSETAKIENRESKIENRRSRIEEPITPLLPLKASILDLRRLQMIRDKIFFDSSNFEGASVVNLMSQFRATANAHMRRDMMAPGAKWLCQCEACKQ